MLEQYRKEIDQIDEQLVDLFEKRMDTAKKVGEYKKERGLEIFCPDREKAVIKKRTEQTKNPAYRQYTAEFFEDIMRISRSLQAKVLNGAQNFLYQPADFFNADLKVVYPGVVGSYSGGALNKFFPAVKHKLNVNTFLEAAKLVANGEADFGVLPFENNSSGAIADTLDLILSEHLYIAGETYVDVRHCLLGTSDAEMEDIKEIYSHNQGFVQSGLFLSSLKADIKCVPMENTALAAKYVAECGNKKKAAIASRLAAESYGLKILKENIHENSGNTTRFVVVSNKLTCDNNCDKISAAFTTRHKSGALCDVLAVFARNGVNLMHIESRPLKQKDFSYMFYIDFEGNLADSNVADAITQIKETGAELILLGNYRTENVR